MIPAREVLAGPGAAEKISRALARLLAAKKKKNEPLPSTETFTVEPGGEIKFIDRFIDYVYENSRSCLLDYMAQGCLMLLEDQVKTENSMKPLNGTWPTGTGFAGRRAY